MQRISTKSRIYLNKNKGPSIFSFTDVGIAAQGTLCCHFNSLFINSGLRRKYYITKKKNYNIAYAFYIDVNIRRF